LDEVRGFCTKNSRLTRHELRRIPTNSDIRRNIFLNQTYPYRKAGKPSPRHRTDLHSNQDFLTVSLGARCVAIGVKTRTLFGLPGAAPYLAAGQKLTTGMWRLWSGSGDLKGLKSSDTTALFTQHRCSVMSC